MIRPEDFDNPAREAKTEGGKAEKIILRQPDGSETILPLEQPEVAVAANQEVQHQIEVVSVIENHAAALENLAAIAKEGNPELAERMSLMQGELDARAEVGEHDLEIAKLKAEIGELNKTVQQSAGMEKFGAEHGFSKDETYAFVEKKVLENEQRIRELEGNKGFLAAEKKAQERKDEINRLKAEIYDLNKLTQESGAMERFGAEHGFNKDKTYQSVEKQVLDNEAKIRELEGANAPKKEVAPKEDGAQASEGVPDAGPEDEKKEPATETIPPNTPATPETAPLTSPEDRYNRPLSPADKEHLLRSFSQENSEKKEGKNWWGWIKERAKGLATFGFWEFHQAERFRSNKKEVAGEIAEQAEKIRKTENLSLEDALEEAQIMRMMAQGANVEKMEAADYERYSQIVSGHKIEENNKHIEATVAKASADLKKRLVKYRDEFGKVVTNDEAVMANFESGLRTSLLEQQNGQKLSDAKEFNKVITERLDPKYWKRYVYGALETLLAAGGLQLAVNGLSMPNWWLGKKTVDTTMDVVGGGNPGPENTFIGPQLPEGDESMHNTIWRTSKEWLAKHGVPNPTDKEVMDLSKQVAVDNDIGVKEWGIAGNPLDTGMEQGHILKFGGAMKILTAIKIARGIASII